MSSYSELTQMRVDIDQIDNRILALLEERYALVNRVMKRKQHNTMPIRDADREQEIISRLQSVNSSFSKDAVAALFELILLYTQGRHQS